MRQTPDPGALRRFGAGPRAAVLMHCSLAHSGAWTALAGRLEDRLAMTAFDLPGHGRAPDWDGHTDLHDISTGWAAALAGAGPVDLIGHSFGATVALRLALERPGAVRSLTMIEPVLFAAAAQAGDPAFEAHQRATAPFDAAWAAGDAAEAARRFVGLWGAGKPWEALAPAQRAAMIARIGFVAATAHVLGEDAHGLLAPGRLEGLARPALIVTGGESPAVIPAIARALTARLPDAAHEVVAGAGHMVPLTHPGPVADAITALLERS